MMINIKDKFIIEIGESLEHMIYEKTWGLDCNLIWNLTMGKMISIDGGTFPYAHDNYD